MARPRNMTAQNDIVSWLYDHQGNQVTMAQMRTQNPDVKPQTIHTIMSKAVGGFLPGVEAIRVRNGLYKIISVNVSALPDEIILYEPTKPKRKTPEIELVDAPHGQYFEAIGKTQEGNPVVRSQDGFVYRLEAV
jgi:hypothetical protein